MTRAGLLAVLLLFPFSASAEGDMRMLALYVIVVPTIVIFFAVSSVLWFICSERVRPWAIAICAIPLSPIEAGESWWWPLSVSFQGWYPPGGPWSVVVPIIGTFLITNLAVRLLARKAWRLGAILALLRILVFLALYARGPGDEQAPLQYWPLWVLDFPISIAYFVVPLSIPLYEAVVGPVWWLFVPTIVARSFRVFRGKKTTGPVSS